MVSSPARLAVLLLAAACTGCAGLGLAGPGRGERAAGVVAISVEELPGEDVWQLGYALAAPAAGVEFAGAGAAWRREGWAVAAPRAEAHWRLDSGRERLCFSRPVQGFAVSFRTGSDPPGGDHRLTVAFSDGSRLLYTGHLLVRPLASCGGSAGEGPAGPPPGAHRFTFRTASERTVRVLDRTARGELRWHPAPGEAAAAGTYVFFGALEPVESAAATAILDPGLPAWMRADTAALVPRTVERFGERTGTALPLRPLVLVAWGGDGGSGRSFSGAALPGGLLVASAEGPGWLDGSPGARLEWFHRLARELFHLWAGEALRPDPESAWLPAAAADHFAADAAVALGLRSQAEAGRRLVERANDCLVRLEARSLTAAAGGSGGAGSPADPAIGLSCGAVAMAAADGALRRGEPPRDLAALFRRLFEHAAATGGYGSGAFLGGLRELGAEPQAVADLRRLIRAGGVEQADLFLRFLLGHAGVAAEPAPAAEATAGRETLREMVRRAVGRCYCGTDPAASCDPAATGRRVRSVAGEAPDPEPLAAWERLEAAVALGAALPVVLGDEEVTLFCASETFDPTWRGLLRLVEPEPPPAPPPGPAPAPPGRAARRR